MTDLLTVSDPFPEVAIESLRKIFPYPRSRKLELVCVHKTLERLVQGETGSPMTPAEAVSYLRGRLEAAAQALGGRAKAYTPHLTTYLNGRRYLTATPQETPKNLEDAISILGCYPNIDVKPQTIQAWMSVLQIINDQIKFLQQTHGQAAASYIRTRVIRFAEMYSRWPDEERQFLASPRKFFEEQRWNQDERHWQRISKSGFISERAQISRLVQ